MTIKKQLILLLLSLPTIISTAQDAFKPVGQDSLKGTITKERVWWDVQHYDISLDIDFDKRRIVGKNTIDFRVIQNPHSQFMQIDLQEPLSIDSIKTGEAKLQFKRYGAAYIIDVSKLSEEIGKLDIYYSGTPKESKNPPYDGGFVWAKDSLNREWISVTCQMVGGSIWYPCKDHYSEEPDRGASLTISLNDSLGVLIGNGRLKSRRSTNGKTEYTWAVTNPINNYGISFYIGKYVNINEVYQGEKGELDLDFWVLDYNRNKAISHLIPETIKTIKVFEKWFGPYPFYEDGLKMVESSYIGMEHQSAVAYGNKFKKGRFSFKNLTELDLQSDRLIVHELAHEWFGNNITMSDIADRWVQEGFAAYGEELFIEELLGREAGRDFYLTRLPNKIKNKYPLISDYGVFKDAGPDMYFKGWAIIHMLREIINDDAIFQGFIRAINQKFYHQTIYSQQLEEFCSNYFKRDFSKYFDQYLRFPSIPIFEYTLTDNKLKFRLVADVKNLEIPIKLNSPNKWINATTGWQEIKLKVNEMLKPLSVDANFLIDVRRVD
ncbi:MAG TPA: M1 family metallopeptidase [Flavobacteriaceae bacterium]